MDVIRGAPTPGLTYNPNDARYWDPAGLAQEIERVYEICHGCRLCFNLCPTFPAMFKAIDGQDGDSRKITVQDHAYILDTCYQCKLCYVKCPYTPDDKHEFQLDFPRLLIRANMQRVKANGIGLRERVLSHPDEVGTMAGLTAPLTNWANKQPLLRAGLEATLGIHKDKLLPDFHGESFIDWAAGQPETAGDPNQAVLFATCFVNHNNPQVGKDALEVFSKNGVALKCPKQNCCGMPAIEAGDIDLARKLAASNVASLLPHVEAGKKVLAINPTCSYMLRKEYAELLGTPEAAKVGAATMDLCEFLFEKKRAGQFNREFQSTPGKVAYHLACHLKAQNIGFRSRDLMRLIPGATIAMVEQCSAHDGTWAMKKEFFPLSMLTGKKAFDEMKEAEPETMATDCPLAAIQFDQAIGTRPIHPIQVLKRAYEPNGFPMKIQPVEITV